jgi:hypothetical protein
MPFCVIENCYGRVEVLGKTCQKCLNQCTQTSTKEKLYYFCRALGCCTRVAKFGEFCIKCNDASSTTTKLSELKCCRRQCENARGFGKIFCENCQLNHVSPTLFLRNEKKHYVKPLKKICGKYLCPNFVNIDEDPLCQVCGESFYFINKKLIVKN